MNPARILLVDDEPNIIRALRRLFFDEDYQVHSAPSGEEALELLRSNEVDLIIADYRMSGMNGIEFFRHARQIQSDAVRIILSGYAELHALTEAINEGNIYRFIFKPWNDDELKNTIQLALEQQRLMLENRSLGLELRRKNEQLHDFNRQLEFQVRQRTRELLFQNQVLSVSQEILELVPVGVVGFSSEGVIAVMNQMAQHHLPGSVGQIVEDALPAELAARCRQLLREAPQALRFRAEIQGVAYDFGIHHLTRAEKVNGGVLIFYHRDMAPEAFPDPAARMAEPALH
jgi:two-component system NtrC family sensor kinase